MALNTDTNHSSSSSSSWKAAHSKNRQVTVYMAEQEECSVVVWKGVEWKRTSSTGPSHDWPSIFAHSQMAGGASEFLNIRLLSVCRPLQSGVADTGFLSQHSRGSSTRGPHRAELVASCGKRCSFSVHVHKVHRVLH